MNKLRVCVVQECKIVDKMSLVWMCTVYTSKYRQLLGSKKKWGQSPQNWARTVETKFQPKCRKSRFREIREF